jgi:hypothetical protein
VIPAPDLVEPVVGYRAWKLIDDRLLSPYIPCRWEGPVMHAACYPANRSLLRGEGWLDAPHASPHPACRCGIHAYHALGAQAYYGEWLWVEGAVTVWGHLEVHHRGLRAEHARVEALVAPDERDAARAQAAAAAAARLGVPLVRREAIEATAAEVGTPLPRALLP